MGFRVLQSADCDAMSLRFLGLLSVLRSRTSVRARLTVGRSRPRKTHASLPKDRAQAAKTSEGLCCYWRDAMSCCENQFSPGDCSWPPTLLLNGAHGPGKLTGPQ